MFPAAGTAARSLANDAGVERHVRSRTDRPMHPLDFGLEALKATLILQRAEHDLFDRALGGDHPPTSRQF